ncbi:hypothetical protein [Mesorhizobium xinjiangense]|uniref:hypothetical protein n=1 Tax=Mesorhizobium xinjiangense TaxID=2678685 RepID=UPI0012EED471|nr:hypothetical protein [Mesorhizobium xinjiangense]
MNITSSAFMLAGRPTEKLLGSLALGPKSGGDILRQQALREYAYTVSALGDGWEALVEAFKRGDSILNPHNTEYFGAGGSGIVQQPLPWKPVHGVWDIVENAWKMANYRTIVGLPTRSLGAVDEFFKMLRYRAVVQAEAAAKANAMGLVGDDLRGHVSREMEKAIDPATGRALNAGALQEAQVSTFQQELLQGTAGATIQQVRSRHPVLTFVLPFVKTPINVLRYGWKMTPGLNLVQKEFREAIFGSKGPEAKAQAIGQMALGSTFMGLAAALALDGKITGAGPSDPNLRRELAATGWQPYAYVLEADDGSKRYVPIGRLDPAGMAFSMVANLVEIMRNDPHGDHGTAERGIGALGLALAKNFTDRTFLLNLHQALQALSDPGARGERYLGSIAGNTIPLSSAIRGLNPDPYLREARSFIDTMMKNLPGYSETLAPSRDAFGDPVWKRIGMSTTSEADIVEAEHTRIILETGGGIGRPDPKFEGVDLRDIALKSGRQAYDRFQELAGHPPGAKSLKTALAELIRSDTYQDLPDGEAGVKGTRLNAIGRIVGKYREAGKKALIRENPELRDLLKARQREARSAYLKSKEERTQKSPGAKALRNALRPRH